MIDQNIEAIMLNCGTELAKHNPKLLQTIIEKKYFVTAVNGQKTEHGKIITENVIIIDTQRTLGSCYSWEIFKQHSLNLYDKFNNIHNWYRA